MQFGICTAVENSAIAKAAGWDFVEERVDLFIQGTIPDAQWNGRQRMKSCVLPLIAANVLVPAAIKITGPDASLDRLKQYMAVVLDRCKEVGIKTLVFGSGGARNVPDGFDRNTARSQILEFLKMLGPMVQQRGIMLVIEHLNRKECNIINSIEEAMTYVKELNHPHVQCLADSYHFWLNDESLATLKAAMPWIRHVHVSDTEGRVPPGTSGKYDYRPFFEVIKRAGYDGPVCVESNWPALTAESAASVLEFIRKQWQAS